MVGDTESKNYKKYHEVMDMIGNGRFGWTIVHYKGGETGNGMFKEPGIIIDGGRLKTEPWEVFKELEKDLGLLPYFDRSKFTQRPDGYFCVKLGGLKKTETGYTLNQDCMPETKGRTKLNENSNMYEMSAETRQKLENFYHDSNKAICEAFNMSLSWFNEKTEPQKNSISIL